MLYRCVSLVYLKLSVIVHASKQEWFWRLNRHYLLILFVAVPIYIIIFSWYFTFVLVIICYKLYLFLWFRTLLLSSGHYWLCLNDWGLLLPLFWLTPWQGYILLFLVLELDGPFLYAVNYLLLGGVSGLGYPAADFLLLRSGVWILESWWFLCHSIQFPLKHCYLIISLHDKRLVALSVCYFFLTSFLYLLQFTFD